MSNRLPAVVRSQRHNLDATARRRESRRRSEERDGIYAALEAVLGR